MTSISSTHTPESNAEAGRLAKIWQRRAGIIGWLSAVDHKSIGRRYIATGFLFFALAGLAALLMRLQLMYPEATILNTEQYNQLFSVHGSTMMFLFAVPIMQAVGIYLVPLLIGARDVAFPKANALGYYIYLLAGLMLWASLFLGSAPDGGWFAYTPLTETRYSPTYGMDVYNAFITGTEIPALIAAVTLIITIFKFRAPGMSLNRMPLFVWAMLVTAFMVIFAMPSVVIASTELMLDRGLNMNFFNPNLGGNPLLWQHLFWFFGHPEVYIIFVPALGMVSEILGAFTRRPVVGYPFLVISLVAIGVISFGLWVHHMFTTGLPVLGLSMFTIASMVIAIPSGVQIFSALATLWHGKLNLKTPLLYVLGFLATFVIGGVTGVMVASVPFDSQAHDTYFVVAHLHYVLIGGAVFPLLGAIYYWFPKMTGRMMSEALGRWNFALTFIGFNLTFFPMHLSGLYGMPRRVYTYQPGLGWDATNFLSSVGAIVLGLGVLLFVLNTVISLRAGKRAPDNPWGAGTLEWATSSPPPPHNFQPIPNVHGRYPVWDTSRHAHTYDFDTYLDRREALVTTALEAKPEQRAPLPSRSLIPFLLALAVILTLVGTVFHITIVLVGAVLSLILLGVWHYPKPHERSMEWVKAGPDDALQVSTVVKGKGKHPPFYYAMLLFIVIEAVEFGALIASYFYLRAGTHDWPPGDLPYPDLALPILATLFMLASVIPTYLGDHAIKKGDQRGLVRGLAATIVLESLFLVLMVVHLSFLNFKWDTNAYGSLYWTLTVTHLIFTFIMILENAYVLVLARQGFYNEERHWGVEMDGVGSYFVAAAWVAVFITVFLSPYLLQ